MRFSSYFVVSSVLTAAAMSHAFQSRVQFYPAVIYLVTSKISMLILGNMALMLTLLFGRVTKTVFFGQLRDVEVEILYDNARYAITETCLALTIFREELTTRVLTLFTALLFSKSFHWLCQSRVEYVESDNVSRWTHLRLVTLMISLLTVDICFVVACIYLWRGPSVLILFGFEYTILAVSVLSTFSRYILHVIDMNIEGNWPQKGSYLFFLEFITEVVRFLSYVVFFTIIFTYYGMPLHIVRDLWMSYVNLKRRLIIFNKYRKLTANMNERFPDATEEELAACEHTCIICRDAMDVGKKLPCGHIFHLDCLRLWLQQQQSCPTCRAEIPTEMVPSTTAGAGVGAGGLPPRAGPLQGVAAVGAGPGQEGGGGNVPAAQQQQQQQPPQGLAAGGGGGGGRPQAGVAIPRRVHQPPQHQLPGERGAAAAGPLGGNPPHQPQGPPPPPHHQPPPGLPPAVAGHHSFPHPPGYPTGIVGGVGALPPHPSFPYPATAGAPPMPPPPFFNLPPWGVPPPFPGHFPMDGGNHHHPEGVVRLYRVVDPSGAQIRSGPEASSSVIRTLAESDIVPIAARDETTVPGEIKYRVEGGGWIIQKTTTASSTTAGGRGASDARANSAGTLLEALGTFVPPFGPMSFPPPLYSNTGYGHGMPGGGERGGSSSSNISSSYSFGLLSDLVSGAANSGGSSTTGGASPINRDLVALRLDLAEARTGLDAVVLGLTSLMTQYDVEARRMQAVLSRLEAAYEALITQSAPSSSSSAAAAGGSSDGQIANTTATIGATTTSS